MNPEQHQALEYLRAPAAGPWRWAENGAVLVWEDDTTIAFREELAPILEYVGRGGLPPFGALVLLLAAARGKFPAEQPRAGSGFAEALRQLRRVAELPDELRLGLRARCVLAEAVLENVPARLRRPLRPVLEALALPGLAEEHRSAGPSGPGHEGAIHLLAEGLKGHTAESLALRVRTGLDALPGAAEIDLSPARRAHRLIEGLSRDPEVGLVARAARELMAAVRLPRRLGEREEAATGGVAGLTQRGPLDRLLLSELAHDDLTLAVRVALNEALYLRREPPPCEPPGTLSLLFDSGVRQWGVPRVLATAVGLALVARDGQRREVRCWRAHRLELAEVNLFTRSGLLQQLAALETDAHPGAALPAFARQVAAEAGHQSVIITHRDTLEDPEFRRALSATAGVPDLIATVDRAGTFELHALPLSRRPPLCAARIDLEAIFDSGPGRSPRRLAIDPALPVIFGVNPFPFLLPLSGSSGYSVAAMDGDTIVLLAGRALARFRDVRKGGRMLATDLPPGDTVWMGVVDDEVHVIKSGTRRRPARLVSVPATGGPARVTDLPGDSSLCAGHAVGDVILLIGHLSIRAHALGDGRLLATRSSPYQWLNGRYFRAPDGFRFVGWDGSSICLERLTLPGFVNERNVCLIFDRQGFEGPWLVREDGLVLSTTGEHQETLPVLPEHLGRNSIQASRDGHRIYWVFPDEHEAGIKDLKEGRVKKLNPDSKPQPLLNPPPRLPNWNVHRTLDAIAVLSDGIALRGRRGRWRKLVLESGPALRLGVATERDLHLAPVLHFPAKGRGTPHGCTLRIAQFPNGARVFLDSRGLLHFKGGDPALPEVSLVLAEKEVAGWTSDGFTCGLPFFFELPAVRDAGRVWDRLQRLLR